MKESYKILLTMSEFMYGSKLRNICDLVRGLDKDIFKFEIAGLDIDNEALDEIKALDVPYFQLRTVPTTPYNLRRLTQTAFSPIKLAGKKYDLVHSFLYQSVFTEALIFKVSSRARYIYTKSNLEWNNHSLNWRLKSILADRIISISKATDDLLTSKGFEKKIARIYLGIDTAQFMESKEKRDELRRRLGIPDSAIVFGCAAQFVEWKEHLTVVSAFETIRQRDSNIYLLFAGPHHGDNYYRSVEKRISESPDKDHIMLLGTVQDMTAFYSAIDCFVLVSRYETFGYVYIEAMSCGKPVIACKAGGPLEIVSDKVSGFLVDLSSPTSLAEHMIKYLQDKELICKHGRSGRERAVQIFSKATMVGKCQDLYLQTISKSR